MAGYSQDRKVWAAQSLASETMIGSAERALVEASSAGEDDQRMACRRRCPGHRVLGAVARVGVPAGPAAPAAHRVCAEFWYASASFFVSDPSDGTGPPVGQAVPV